MRMSGVPWECSAIAPSVKPCTATHSPSVFLAFLSTLTLKSLSSLGCRGSFQALELATSLLRIGVAEHGHESCVQRREFGRVGSRRLGPGRLSSEFGPPLVEVLCLFRGFRGEILKLAIPVVRSTPGSHSHESV